ncbi:hypothetical protein SRHO_G00159010 [Serrasalmus rhombeus]
MVSELDSSRGSAGLWVPLGSHSSMTPGWTNPKLPIRLSPVHFIFSVDKKMDQTKTEKHSHHSTTGLLDTHTYALKYTALTQMACTNHKCCVTPAPCGHGRVQIASKEGDASWLNYSLVKGKGFQADLSPFTLGLPEERRRLLCAERPGNNVRTKQEHQPQLFTNTNTNICFTSLSAQPEDLRWIQTSNVFK